MNKTQNEFFEKACVAPVDYYGKLPVIVNGIVSHNFYCALSANQKHINQR